MAPHSNPPCPPPAAEALRAAVDQLPVIMWSTDLDFRCTAMWGAGLASLGLEGSSLVGRSLLDFAGGVSGSPLHAAHAGALAGRVERCVFAWRERYFEALVQPQCNAQGTVAGCLGLGFDVTEHMETRTRLAELVARFDDLAENVPGLLYQTLSAADGSWVKMPYLSRFAETYLGYTPDEVQADPQLMIAAIHPDDRQAYFEAAFESIRNQTPFVLEFRMVSRTGEVRWVRANSRSRRMPDGSVLANGLAFDISDRKRAEAELHHLNEELEARVLERTTALRQSDAKLEASRQFAELVAEATPAIIYVYDLQQKCNVYTNRRFQEILGYPRAEAERPGTPLFAECFHPDDLPAIADAHKQFAAAADNQVVVTEYRMRDQHGAWHAFRSHDVVFSRHADGSPRQILGTAVEITAQRRSDDLLRESEERWKSLANTSVDYLVMLDREHRLTYVNRLPATSTWAGTLGKSVFEFVLPADRELVRHCLEHTLRTGEFTSYEHLGPSPEGEWRWYSTRVGPLKQGLQIAGTTLFVTDITDRRRMEDSLRAERQLLRRLLDLQHRERRLLAYEIHDGFVQDVIGTHLRLGGIAAWDPPLPEDVVDELESAQVVLGRAVAEARRLIGELRPMVIDSHGLVAAIDDLVQDISATSGIPISFGSDVQFDRLAPEFEGNVFRIAQEILNNVKRHSRATAVDVRLLQRKSNLRLEVVDNGMGFDRAKIKREHFGLESIQERARLFGGWSEIQSAVGAGTAVTIEIPLDPPAEQFPANPNPGIHLPGGEPHSPAPS